MATWRCLVSGSEKGTIVQKDVLPKLCTSMRVGLFPVEAMLPSSIFGTCVSQLKHCHMLSLCFVLFCSSQAGFWQTRKGNGVFAQQTGWHVAPPTQVRRLFGGYLVKSTFAQSRCAAVGQQPLALFFFFFFFFFF